MGSQESKPHVVGSSSESSTKRTDQYPVESTFEDDSKVHRETPNKDTSQLLPPLNDESSKTFDESTTEGTSKYTDPHPFNSSLVELNSKVHSEPIFAKAHQLFPLNDESLKPYNESTTEGSLKHTDQYPVESTFEDDSKVHRETPNKDTSQLLPPLNDESSKTFDESTTEGTLKYTDPHPFNSSLEELNSKVHSEPIFAKAHQLFPLNDESLKPYNESTTEGSLKHTDQYPVKSTFEEDSKVHRETPIKDTSELLPPLNDESSKTYDERTTEGTSEYTDQRPFNSSLEELNSKVHSEPIFAKAHQLFPLNDESLKTYDESTTEGSLKHTDQYPVKSTFEEDSKVHRETPIKDTSLLLPPLNDESSKTYDESTTEGSSKHTDPCPLNSSLEELNSKVHSEPTFTKVHQFFALNDESLKTYNESTTEGSLKHTDPCTFNSSLEELNSKLHSKPIFAKAHQLFPLNNESLKTHVFESIVEGAANNTDSNPVKSTVEEQNSQVKGETLNTSNNSTTPKKSSSFSLGLNENASVVVNTAFSDEIISKEVVTADIQRELPKKENYFLIKSTESIDNILSCESSFEVNVEEDLHTDLIAPKNVKVNFLPTENSNRQTLEWSTDLVNEYLSKVYSVLNQIKSPSPSNIHLNDLSDLQNSTSFLISQIQGIESVTATKQQNYMLCIADMIKLNELRKKYKFLSIQTNTTFYCTLCKVFIKCDLQNNDYSEIEKHLKSVLHKETEIDMSLQIKEEESNNSAQYLKNVLRAEYENQKEYLKIVDQIVKCTLCEEIWQFDVDLSVIENHFKKESHLNYCRSAQVENNLQENYRNAMEFIKTNMSSLEINFPNTVVLFYICCLCDFVTSTADVWRNHIKAEFASNDGKKINSYCCDSCKVVLFGVVDVYKEHCLLTTHKQLNTENESYELEEGQQLGLAVNVHNHFDKCNVPKEERISTHENFLNKVVKNYSNDSRGNGFYCSVCNMYMFYGQNRIEHTDMHIYPDSKLPVKVSKLFCTPCNVDVYCEDHVVKRTRKEHISLPAHHIMAKAMGLDPNDIAHIYLRDTTTYLNLTSDNVVENIDVTAENNNSDTELSEKSATKGDCAIGEKLEKIGDKSKKIIHEEFLEKILALYHGEDAIGQKHDEIPRRGFYCELCNIYRFYGHKLKRHKLKHTVFDSNVESESSTSFNCELFTCRTCNIELYGKPGLLKYHNRLPSHKKMENEIVYDGDSNLVYRIEKTVPKKLSFLNKIHIEENYASLMNDICSRITPYESSFYSPLNSSSFMYICTPCDFVTNCNGVFKDHCRNDKHEGLVRFTCDCCCLVLCGTPSVINEHGCLSQHVYIKETATNLLEFPLSETPDTPSQHGVFLDKMFQLYKENKTDRSGFYCKICNRYGFHSTKFKNVHTKTKHHLRTELVNNNSSICQEFYCQPCKVDLFGPCDVLTDHFGFSAHKKMAGLEDDANETLSSSTSLSNYGESQGNVSDNCKNLDEGAKTKNDDFNQIAANISSTILPEEINPIPNTNNSRKTTKELKTATVSTVNNDESYTASDTKSLSSEKQNGETKSRPFNELNKDQNHEQIMTFVAKEFFKIPRSTVPKTVGYLCEVHKECFYDKSKWEEHINVKEHKELGSHFCTVCRVLFLSTDDYFENHLLSIGHCAIKEITIQRRTSISEQDEKESTAAQSADESSSSSENTDEDNNSIKKEKKTKNKKKGNKLKPKIKSLGLLVQGFHPDTKSHEFYKLFYSMGFKVNYVTMNYKDRSGNALVMFHSPADPENILERKKPIVMNEMELQVTSLKLKGKGDPVRFNFSADLHKLFFSPAVCMGVIDRIIFRYSLIAEKEAKKTNQVLVDIKQSLRNVDVYPFGSRVYGTTSLSSDLDVFVDIDGETYFDNSPFKDRRVEENIIWNIANDLKRSKAFRNIAVIPARVPIVRLVHRETNLACDVSSLSGLSVENTKLTKCYLESDPRVAWLVTAVKYWAVINCLKDSSKFTSYALTWMVLYFLMQLDEPVVCPVETLRKLKYTPKPPITGWDCQFCADVKLYPKTKNTQLVLELLHDFFVFYGTVDHANYVFCPIVGKAIHSDKFKQFDLPECFQRYVDKIRVTREHIQLKKPFCVQDPLDLGHNVTKNVKKNLLNHFKLLCRKSATLCEEW